MNTTHLPAPWFRHLITGAMIPVLLMLPAWTMPGQHREAATTAATVMKVPDTGQTTDYTATPGEDSDYLINAPTYTVHADGTVTDNITGLMWQRIDGGEMTRRAAATYCDTLTLGGYGDWRLPKAGEVFVLLNHDKVNPALDVAAFTKTTAEYWWAEEGRADDGTRVWAANAGGGIGAHAVSETISAGGTRRFHVRAVRVPSTQAAVPTRLVRQADGTVHDMATGLMWQQVEPSATMPWDAALRYGDTLSLGGYRDWRLPNIKELQSINDPGLVRPSLDTAVFPNAASARHWSSTTQCNSTGRAWYLDTEFGIVTYSDKTTAMHVLCVRGPVATDSLAIREVAIPGGEFAMGDHHGFVDPSHPSDELPVHTVRVSSFVMAATEMTNRMAADLWNSAAAAGLIEVRGGCVYLRGGTDTLAYLNTHASYSSIGHDGTRFSVVDFRADHPVVGIMWKGAALLCNMASRATGLQECYATSTWSCSFTATGYRLPTEAEWEYAGRGGRTAPYQIYPTGDVINRSAVNLPQSGDPYETGPVPNTTPAGFYDGTLKQKSVYNWPGAMTTYQTASGANDFGLYDMQGNVWEYVNDWYGQKYYEGSPVDDPTGPTSGFIMPDGRPYRGMRGGNWYNGLTTNGVNDGHSRVANRNPSYYRGPQDPNHPYYHIGFRMVRRSSTPTGVDETERTAPGTFRLHPNHPNPFSTVTSIVYDVPAASPVRVTIINTLGQTVATLVDGLAQAGIHAVRFDAHGLVSGVYYCRYETAGHIEARPLLLAR